MYTVKDLIEALQGCPQEYKIYYAIDTRPYMVEVTYVDIDHEDKCVDLFTRLYEPRQGEA